MAYEGEGDDEAQKIYLNYKRGINILHDPKIGVVAPLVESNLYLWAILIIIGILGTIGIIGATIWKYKLETL